MPAVSQVEARGTPGPAPSISPDGANPVDVVGLSALMGMTLGSREVVIGLLDGPVEVNHPDLETAGLRWLGSSSCSDAGVACRHGTFIAGMLVGKRDTVAPAIAPGCTLLVSPVFSEPIQSGVSPSSSVARVADAMVACVDAGARVLNLSAVLSEVGISRHAGLEHALDYITRRRALLVAAAGNGSSMTGSALTRHPGVVPVVAFTRAGSPLAQSNLGRSLGARGIGAPGEGVTSLKPGGGRAVATGTSVAAPFVTGAIALLWSLMPSASSAEVKGALLHASVRRRTSVVPPLLNAGGAYRALISQHRKVQA